MQHRVSLPRDPVSARSARLFLRDTMDAWDASADMEALNLATSELVTNALVHGRGAVGLTMRLEAGSLRVEVADDSREIPVLLPNPGHATSGRGMNIVEALSDGWGVDIVPNGGKVVWFTVAATTRPRTQRPAYPRSP
jgi:anti-sigma regulatory factor (Ser/Thr protein kinase)